jgi:hypothetical protein
MVVTRPLSATAPGRVSGWAVVFPGEGAGTGISIEAPLAPAWRATSPPPLHPANAQANPAVMFQAPNRSRITLPHHPAGPPGRSALGHGP